MKYIVNIVETLSKQLIVEAESKENAVRKIQDAYNAGEIRLNNNNETVSSVYSLRRANNDDSELIETWEE